MKHPIRTLALLAISTLFVVVLAISTNTPQRVLADDPTPTATPTLPPNLVAITMDGGLPVVATNAMWVCDDGYGCQNAGTVTCNYPAFAATSHTTITCSGTYDYQAGICGANHHTEVEVLIYPVGSPLDLDGWYYYNFHGSNTIVTNENDPNDHTYVRQENANANPQSILSADEYAIYPSTAGFNYHHLRLHAYFSNPSCSATKIDSFTYQVSLSDIGSLTPPPFTLTPSPTKTFTPSITPTFTSTPTKTLTPTPTSTSTKTNTPTITPTPEYTVTFYSDADDDGWVLESSETSEVGGSLNETGNLFLVGDDSGDKQYRSILSFDTSSLPDNAVIQSITLRIRLWGIVGTDLLSTYNLRIDMTKPKFGTSIALQDADFEDEPATNFADTVAIFAAGSTPDPNDWYSANMTNATAKGLINLTNKTQLRLRFGVGDNDNATGDNSKFYTGESTTGNAPQLIITYTVP